MMKTLILLTEIKQRSEAKKCLKHRTVIKFRIRKSGKVAAGISLPKDLSSCDTERKEKTAKGGQHCEEVGIFFSIVMIRKLKLT